MQPRWNTSARTYEFIQPTHHPSPCWHLWVYFDYFLHKLTNFPQFLSSNTCFLKLLLGYRFVHESVGEGDDRHLVLQQCLDTSMYVSILIFYFVCGHLLIVIIRCTWYECSIREALSTDVLWSKVSHCCVNWNFRWLHSLVQFCEVEDLLIRLSTFPFCRPSILVSDILWHFDACESPPLPYQLLRRDDACTGKFIILNFGRGSVFMLYCYSHTSPWSIVAWIFIMVLIQPFRWLNLL